MAAGGARSPQKLQKLGAPGWLSWPQHLLQSRGPRSREGVQTEAAMEMTQRHSEWGKPMMPTGCSAVAETMWKPPAVTSHPFAPIGPDGSHFSPHTPRLAQQALPSPQPIRRPGVPRERRVPAIS